MLFGLSAKLLDCGQDSATTDPWTPQQAPARSGANRRTETADVCSLESSKLNQLMA